VRRGGARWWSTWVACAIPAHNGLGGAFVRPECRRKASSHHGARRALLTWEVGVGFGESGHARSVGSQASFPPPLPSRTVQRSAFFRCTQRCAARRRALQTVNPPLPPEVGSSFQTPGKCGSLPAPPNGTRPSRSAFRRVPAIAYAVNALCNSPIRAVVYVPVAMPSGTDDENSMFVEPFHASVWLGQAPKSVEIAFVQTSGGHV
jgi:hypothetical protein